MTTEKPLNPVSPSDGADAWDAWATFSNNVSEALRELPSAPLFSRRAAVARALWDMGYRPTAEQVEAEREKAERRKHVEWGHRYPDGSVVADSSEIVARSRAVICRARSGTPLVLVRRTVTEWEEVDD